MVATKGELLVAATVGAPTHVLREPDGDTPPEQAVHAIALGAFDAIDAHPWLGAQLFAVPWRPAVVQLWEHLKGPLEQLGVPEAALFTAVSTLVNYTVEAFHLDSLRRASPTQTTSSASRICSVRP